MSSLVGRKELKLEILIGHFDATLSLKFAAAFVALTNPLYGIPIFLGLTRELTPQERRKTAHIVALTVFVAATVALLIGEEILGFFGISISAFQIAGGVIVLGIGLSMLNATRSDGNLAEKNSAPETGKNIAVVPMAIPLTFGPGGFATMILFAHLLSDQGELVTLIPVVLGVSLLTWLGLLFADPIARLLGTTVISVITKIMAIILVAIAVEMVIEGSFQAFHDHFPDKQSPVKS